MLKLNNISFYYGKIHALKSINLEIPKGSIVSLLGANGAGKTTTLKVISRLIQPSEGTYELNGDSMLKTSSSNLVKKGVIHCPENRRVFPLLSVEENLNIGAYLRKDKQKVKEDYEKICIMFPRLKERLKQVAGTLSGGEQQMLAIGRSLMGAPKLLLLDEPSLGLAPNIIQEIFRTIKKINVEGTAILLVEQNAHLSLEISDYSYILENGRVALQGTPEELRGNKDISKLYLGV
ncbi:ABC transporter ATP-binding protein [Psychrobacillus sp. OK032]|uniref:ABC transporter ATP-binding protein n=1 Tax=Psychrobacillus sp. OK032 TaxID=1884358 RepID=UPI0008BDAE95|nr:ABC transporter ATP-binding protein [Psychrobacillus sp. OK032]SER86796.1 amino acid/amide ABC transporter ATP-binding protein 2, HAAT family [Psychrobacillus sp. OK032]